MAAQSTKWPTNITLGQSFVLANVKCYFYHCICTLSTIRRITCTYIPAPSAGHSQGPVRPQPHVPIAQPKVSSLSIKSLAYAHVRTYVSMHVYTYGHAYVRTYVCTYVSMHVYTYCTYMHMYVCLYSLTYVCMYIHNVKDLVNN